jgi:hypothetical protein
MSNSENCGHDHGSEVFAEAIVGTSQFDVEETALSVASWPGSNAAHTYNFATLICRYALKRPSGKSSVIEHFSLSQVSTGNRRRRIICGAAA